MGDYKIQVNDKKESERVQELFFRLGGKWDFGDPLGYQYCDEPYLFLIDFGGNKSTIMYDNNEYDFEWDDSEEVTLRELEELSINKISLKL